jgi:hypothetical protein
VWAEIEKDPPKTSFDRRTMPDVPKKEHLETLSPWVLGEVEVWGTSAPWKNIDAVSIYL